MEGVEAMDAFDRSNIRTGTQPAGVRPATIGHGVLVLGLLLAAAGCSQPVSNTGHLGTWEREITEGRFSRIAFWEEDGKTLFCWSSRGKNTGEQVRCAPGGISETVVRREVIYEYRFIVRPGESEDELFVHVEGIPRDPKNTPINWTDRFVVQPGGLEMLSYKVSLNGREQGGRKPLYFSKIADAPI